MPTYQYACTSAECGHRFEIVQSFTDAALTDCPQCADKVRKVYGSVGVVFKGSGFYRTDSRESSSATVAKAEAKSEAKSDSKSESKSETKSDSSSKPSSTPAAASSGSSSGGSSSSSSSAPAKAAS